MLILSGNVARLTLNTRRGSGSSQKPVSLDSGAAVVVVVGGVVEADGRGVAPPGAATEFAYSYNYTQMSMHTIMAYRNMHTAITCNKNMHIVIIIHTYCYIYYVFVVPQEY